MNFKKVEKFSQENFSTGSDLTAAPLPPSPNFEILLNNLPLVNIIKPAEINMTKTAQCAQAEINIKKRTAKDLTPRSTVDCSVNFKKVEKFSQENFSTGSDLTAAPLPPSPNFEILLNNLPLVNIIKPAEINVTKPVTSLGQRDKNGTKAPKPQSAL